MKKSALFSSIALSVFLVGCGGDFGTTNEPSTSNESSGDGLETNIVTIATGGASGPYNILGTTMGEIYSTEFGINSRTQTTGASVENLNLMSQEKIEMAFVMSDALSQAINAEESFKEPIENVSQIANLYPNVVQIIAKKDSGIETIEDLVGKRVAVGDQNSGVELNARALLNGHGITYDDIQVDYLGYAEAADGLNAGTIDAAFLTSGLPNASVLELSETTGITLVSIESENVEEIAKEHPYFISYEIPAGTYGNEEPIKTAAVPNALVVRNDLSEDDVYKLTKAFFENLDKLANSHQAAKEITLEKAQEGLIAPLHPGAQRYYDEQK
ncbi:TAXI family TRAP transporter solute-binding subunit [Lysinibacillus telephonicus]|uniref:TAXI family TRAP transporter solute-binding subunit n=1 Tax=Lysinibacillus telephonicus TaxID=1714840 RepID=A0A3S0JZC4_9BACI|nr:TAXI family TRAP transporter solute-binding subunit [Lysinibacillus telephonicus]RTQ96063.1 TAXI family TRAP transporter solute-binding subunit [Lysinibacillus telephonicus]